MYLSSMKADTKRIAIHDESGIVVKEFTSQNNKMRNTNTLIYLIDLKFSKIVTKKL
jgi:ABC-2 type transport system permease protein